jgi:hypothetical protein
MASFLTTEKMDPALAARIEASVRGRRHQPVRRAALAPRLVAVARFAVVLVVAVALVAFVRVRRRDRREHSLAREALLSTVRAEAASLTSEDRQTLARAETWLARAAGAYDGDLVADELRAPGALTALLARPALYVRGPVGAFTTPARIAEAAALSSKDALLLCLVDPPASRVEMTMLSRVRIAYGTGTALEQRTTNIRRLHDVEVGLPLLLPPWSERVSAAREVAELDRLRKELERAPLTRAKQGARARLLVFALDEPSERVGPAELDGERAHHVRIGIVDLAMGTVLYRARELVDPTWISMAKKSEYASGLDGCGLAFDVHEGLKAPTRPAP